MLSKAPLFFLVGVTLLTAFSSAAPQAKAEDKNADGKDPKEVQIPGEYTLDTDPDNEEYKKYMQAMGFSEDVQKKLREAKKVTIIIDKLNDTHCQIERVSGKNTQELTFESGKEFEAKLPDGRMVKNTITVNKNEKTVKRVMKMDGFEATHDAEFSEKGFSVTFKAKDAVVMFWYKREKTILEKIKNFGFHGLHKK